MNKRRSILVAVMVLSVVVLVFTWLMQDAPQSAPAAELATGNTAGTTLATNPADQGSRASTVRIIRAPFPAPPVISRSIPVRNIFVAPLPIAPPETVSQATESPLAPAGQPEVKENPFRELHRLTAVMNSASSALALVDDQWLEIGDTFDDCRLIRVESEQAVFSCPNGEIALTITVE